MPYIVSAIIKKLSLIFNGISLMHTGGGKEIAGCKSGPRREFRYLNLKSSPNTKYTKNATTQDYCNFVQ